MKATLSMLVLVSLSSVANGQAPYQYRDRGMAFGALMGALTGGAIGRNNGNTGAGAAIGTALGALTGAAVGDSIDSDMAWNNAVRQQQYAQQMARAVTLADVISMSQAGLSEAVICTHIQNVGVVRRPQPADLITLSNSGVSDTVIRAMQTAPLAASAAPAVPAYRDRVIVQEHYYPAPYPAPAWFHHGPCYRPVHPHHYRPGVHWGFSFGN